MKNYLFCLSLILMGCASSPTPGYWTKESVKGQKVIIFVPGLYGSNLSDSQTGERIYQTLGQALWGKIPLAFKGDELGISGARQLKADGVLDGVTVIPLLYSVDAYGGSIEYLRKQFERRAQVIPFAYDWRDDDFENARALGRLVQDVKSAGARSIAIVAHSLGAVLTAFYLRYGDAQYENLKENWGGSQSVDAVVLAAAPFHGSMASFYDLLHGTSVGLSKTPLAAVSLGSFPSFYQFLPAGDPSTYVERNEKTLESAVYQEKYWPQWKAGLYSDTEGVSAVALDRRFAYTQRYLKGAQSFSKHMQAPLKHLPQRKTPTLVITGMGTATTARALWSGESPDGEGEWVFGQDRLKELFQNRKFSFVEEGDGLVTVRSATPPQAFLAGLEVETASVRMSHRGTYTQEDVQSRVNSFLAGQGF